MTSLTLSESSPRPDLIMIWCQGQARTATSIGFTAVLFWSLLALLTAATGRIPPFQLAAMTFLVGGLVGATTWIRRPEGMKALRQKPVVWALGLGGLFQGQPQRDHRRKP